VSAMVAAVRKRAAGKRCGWRPMRPCGSDCDRSWRGLLPGAEKQKCRGLDEGERAAARTSRSAVGARSDVVAVCAGHRVGSVAGLLVVGCVLCEVWREGRSAESSIQPNLSSSNTCSHFFLGLSNRK